MNATHSDSIREWKARILTLCQKEPLLFCELARIPGAAGTKALKSRGNVILWKDLNPDVAQAVVELQRVGRIKIKRCSRADYERQGKVLDLPPAVSGVGYRYAAPHWQPAMIHAARPYQKPEPTK